MADVVIIGAGISGLTAAADLHCRGHHVVVLDKGRGVGGRLATRRIVTPDGSAAVFDHGAQFFTTRSADFVRVVSHWMDQGLVREWCRGFSEHDGHPRYVVNGGMTALAKHIVAHPSSVMLSAADHSRSAGPLDVRTSTLVFEVRPGAARAWTVVIDDGTTIDCDAVVMTCPLLQSYSLTVTAGAELPPDLLRADYDRTCALLAVLDRPSLVPAPGGLQHPDAVFSWIGDNQAKGISPIPAVTFHAAADWSAEHWDDPPEVGRDTLLTAARPYIGEAQVIAADYKKWRFATPRSVWPDPIIVSPTPPSTLVFAGDACAGPKVEGAFSSGLAAAGHLARTL